MGAAAPGPLLEQGHVVALYQLKAAMEAGLDPAMEIAQALGEGAVLLAEAGLARRRVAVLESVDDDEEHRRPRCHGVDRVRGWLNSAGWSDRQG